MQDSSEWDPIRDARKYELKEQAKKELNILQNKNKMDRYLSPIEAEKQQKKQ